MCGNDANGRKQKKHQTYEYGVARPEGLINTPCGKASDDGDDIQKDAKETSFNCLPPEHSRRECASQDYDAIHAILIQHARDQKP